MKYFDAHCHLQMKEFDADRAEVLARMVESDTSGVVIGVDLATSTTAIELATTQNFLWAAIGLHPHDNIHEAFDVATYTQLAQNPKVVAIGECGLDYSRNTTEEKKVAQKTRFESQIELAMTVAKPLIIHCRDAHDDMLAILKDYMGNHPALKVIIHFCTVNGEVAQQYVDLGCYLSFPGPITYTDMYDESIRVAPMDKILSETDSPFAAPMPNRGKRNEPAYVSKIVEKIASIKDVLPEAMASQIVENSLKVFAIA